MPHVLRQTLLHGLSRAGIKAERNGVCSAASADLKIPTFKWDKEPMSNAITT